MSSSKPSGYKVGIGLLAVSVVAYIVGFATNNWVDGYIPLPSSYSARAKATIGLWKGCVETDCYSFGNILSQQKLILNKPSNYVVASQALTTIGLVGLLLALVYFVIFILLNKFKQCHRRILEVVTALSGLVGLAGTLVFLEVRNEELLRTSNVYPNMAWSFYVTLGGSVLALIAACAIAHNNKKLPPPGSQAPSSVAPVVSSNIQPGTHTQYGIQVVTKTY